MLARARWVKKGFRPLESRSGRMHGQHLPKCPADTKPIDDKPLLQAQQSDPAVPDTLLPIPHGHNPERAGLVVLAERPAGAVRRAARRHPLRP